MNRLATREDYGEDTPRAKASEASPDSPGTPALDIYVKTQTWPVDQRGLLHYKSSAVSTREFKVRAKSESFALQRQQLDTELCVSDEISAHAETLLLIEPSSSSSSPHVAGFRVERKPGELWEHLPSHQTRDISTSELLRFGSLRVRVAEVIRSPQDARAKGEVLLRMASSASDVEASGAAGPAAAADERSCRVCFEEDESETNKLLTPCMCRGSVRHIHSDCLMHWMDGQLLVRRLPENGGCYVLKQLYCELCKYPYSSTVYKNVLIKRPQAPHLVLEELENKQVVRIHVIPTEKKKQLTIGRSKECDIWLTDISVSRRHARILFANDTLKLEDTGSKFGTLIQLTNSCTLKTDQPATQMQIGNTLVTIRVSTISRLASFFIPRRFQPELGRVRVVGNREPSRKSLEREVERRQRAAVLRSELSVAPLALPAATRAQPVETPGNAEQPEDLDDHSEGRGPDALEGAEDEEAFSPETTVFRGSPTHARRLQELDELSLVEAQEAPVGISSV